MLKIISQALNRSHLEQNERAELFEIRRLSTLTSREHNVLCRLIAGQINTQIAADLGTVEKTIKVHRGRVMEKMSEFARRVSDDGRTNRHWSARSESEYGHRFNFFDLRKEYRRPTKSIPTDT